MHAPLQHWLSVAQLVLAARQLHEPDVHSPVVHWLPDVQVPKPLLKRQVPPTQARPVQHSALSVQALPSEIQQVCVVVVSHS